MPNLPKYNFRAKIWLWHSEKKPDSAPWHFVTLPKKISNEIEDLYKGASNAFGSTKVRATTGDSTWETALFLSKEHGFIMPLKAPIRKKEDLTEDQTVSIEIEVLI